MRELLKENWRERAAVCVERWGLSDVEWSTEVSTAHVGFCRAAQGAAVLKVSIEPGMVAFEAEALLHFGSEVCPRVWELTEDQEALLIEKVELVENLAALYPDAEREVDAWLPIFSAVCSASEIPDGFPTVGKFAEVFDLVLGMSLRSDVAGLMRYARDRREILMGGPGEDRLLHGDMHHFNVLHDAGGRWVLIDPHGVVGHPLYELGAFLRNPWRPCYTEPGVVDRLAERVDVLADRLGVPKTVVAEYGFYGAAISLAWSLEESGEVFEGMVTMAEACLSLCA